MRPDDAYFNKLLRILATRCMTQAAYFGSGDAMPAEYHHYGLAAPLYTHFTSPIRRRGPRKQRPCAQPRSELTNCQHQKSHRERGGGRALAAGRPR